MMMPGTIEPAMFAPCGMNCLVCYKHCYHKKPCAGCSKGGRGKPEHCRKCGIKDCVAERQITYCLECSAYPCKQIKRLEKSYNIRYHASLMENSRMVKEQGMTAFLKQQKENYTCPECGGIISIHDAECSECQWKMGGLPCRRYERDDPAKAKEENEADDSVRIKNLKEYKG